MGLINGRVLVVEDEATLRLLVRRRAERAGLHVLEAGTCAQGIALALAEPLDLILLDLQLPDGSGLVLLEQLKASPRTTRVPVIAWSGSDAEESEAGVIQAGATAYFEKTDLKNVVNKIVELVQQR